MTNLTDTFAACLRRYRVQAGLSQSALAAAAGVAPGYVSMLECGRRVPPLDTVETFARALNLGSPLYLLGGVPVEERAAA